MCTGGKSYKAPKPQPLPPPPPAIEGGAGAVLVNEGYGLGNKLKDLSSVHSLVTPFKPVANPRPNVTPEQIIQYRLEHISTLDPMSDEFKALSPDDQKYSTEHSTRPVAPRVIRKYHGGAVRYETQTQTAGQR